MRAWQNCDQDSEPTRPQEKLNRPQSYFYFCEKIENNLLSAEDTFYLPGLTGPAKASIMIILIL